MHALWEKNSLKFLHYKMSFLALLLPFLSQHKYWFCPSTDDFFLYVCPVFMYTLNLNQYNIYRISSLWNVIFSQNGWYLPIFLKTVKLFCFSLLEPMHYHELTDYSPQRSLRNTALSWCFSLSSLLCWPDTKNLQRSCWDRVSIWARSCAGELSKCFYKVSSWCTLVTQTISNLSLFN